MLVSDVAAWNDWRHTHPGITPDLSGADLRRARLRYANLSGVDLRGAHLDGAYLQEADLRRADLRRAFGNNAFLNLAQLDGADCRAAHFKWVRFFRARLVGVNLARAHLLDADFNEADLSHANLTRADLTFCRFIRTDLTGATLDRSRVFGVSSWATVLTETTQRDLIVTSHDEPTVTVDDLDVAQFVYLMLRNGKLRTVIDTVTSKAVLLLGRFTSERKAVLDAVHVELRRRGYLPILFDFDRPSNRDTTETVLTLAGMARFVIADLTDAASVQQELTEIAHALPSVPVQPLVMRGQHEWSMFRDLQRRGAILAPFVYDSPDALLTALAEHVIGPADTEAQRRKTEMERLYTEAEARRTVH